MVAVSNGHKDVVRVLLEGGANPRAMEKYVSYTTKHSLYLKAKLCTIVCVYKFAQGYRTAMEEAVEKQYTEIVAILTQALAKLEKKVGPIVQVLYTLCMLPSSHSIPLSLFSFFPPLPSSPSLPSE